MLYEINLDFCVRNCWDILKSEVIKECGLDLYSLIFMFIVLAISILFRHFLVNYAHDKIETKYFNILLFLQAVLMIFSFIFIGLTIKAYGLI